MRFCMEAEKAWLWYGRKYIFGLTRIVPTAITIFVLLFYQQYRVFTEFLKGLKVFLREMKLWSSCKQLLRTYDWPTGSKRGLIYMDIPIVPSTLVWYMSQWGTFALWFKNTLKLCTFVLNSSIKWSLIIYD